MAQLQKFRQIVEKFDGMADFAIIYITEAHPSDGWFFKVCIEIYLDNPRRNRKLKSVEKPFHYGLAYCNLRKCEIRKSHNFTNYNKT